VFPLKIGKKKSQEGGATTYPRHRNQILWRNWRSK